MDYKIVVDVEVEEVIHRMRKYYIKNGYDIEYIRKITSNIRRLIDNLRVNPYQYPIDSINVKYHKVVFTDCHYKINYYIDDKEKTIYITNLKSFKEQ